MAFIDEAKFFVKAGDGGNGCVSFRREKFVPKGGPDGGDGGEGGSVYIRSSSRLLSLIDFRYRSHFLATSGGGGRHKKMHGKKGVDCEVLVPPGSIIRDAESGEVLAELVSDGDTFLAAQGGHGGLGNVHFATSHNQAPRRATSGKPGDERWLLIELKLLADVGLIGLPNAGKSTLLSKLSAANPKVASYPFTTVEPQLGVMKLVDRRPCIIADIPGLIEGAHQGAGLGHQFLRHIERTRVLLHVIDVSGVEGDPVEQFRVLEHELMQYREELVHRQRFILLNKIDMLDAQQLAIIQQRFAAEADVAITYPISAELEEGLEVVKELITEAMPDDSIGEDSSGESLWDDETPSE